MGIWIDAESLGGVPEIRVSLDGTRDTTKTIPLSHWLKYKKLGYQKQEPFYNADEPKPPSSKKEIPCTGCPKFFECGEKGLECQAFRNWASTGDYNIEHRELKLR